MPRRKRPEYRHHPDDKTRQVVEPLRRHIVELQQDLDDLPSEGEHYASIYVNVGSGATAQTTNGSADTFDVVTGFATEGANGDDEGLEADKAKNRVVLSEIGAYEIGFTCSFSGSANAVMTCKAFIDGTACPNCVFTRKLGGTGDVGSASFIGVVGDVSAGAVLDVRVACDGTSKSFKPWHMALSAHHLHS